MGFRFRKGWWVNIIKHSICVFMCVYVCGGVCVRVHKFIIQTTTFSHRTSEQRNNISYMKY